LRHERGPARLALWVIATLALGGVAFYRWRFALAHDAVWAALLLGLALLPQTLGSALSALFQAHERMEVPAAVGLGINVLKIVLGVAVLLMGWGIIGLGFVALVGSAFSALFFLALTRSLLGLPPWQPDRAFQRDLVREATPLLANALLATLFFARCAAVGIRGDEATGWYTTAYKFIDGLLLIPSLFTLAAFPILSRWGADDPQSLRRASRRAIKALLIVALPVAAGVTLVADQLVLLLFGAAFAPSILALQVLIWFFPFSAVNGFLQYVLIAVNQQRFLTIAFLFATGLNLLANLIAIRLFGLYGAAIVTVLSELALAPPLGATPRW
jgi:O-antigen/teichoic acid export membrane protein